MLEATDALKRFSKKRQRANERKKCIPFWVYSVQIYCCIRFPFDSIKQNMLPVRMQAERREGCAFHFNQRLFRFKNVHTQVDCVYVTYAGISPGEKRTHRVARQGSIKGFCSLNIFGDNVFTFINESQHDSFRYLPCNGDT